MKIVDFGFDPTASDMLWRHFKVKSRGKDPDVVYYDNNLAASIVTVSLELPNGEFQAILTDRREDKDGRPTVLNFSINDSTPWFDSSRVWIMGVEEASSSSSNSSSSSSTSSNSSSSTSSLSSSSTSSVNSSSSSTSSANSSSSSTSSANSSSSSTSTGHSSSSTSSNSSSSTSSNSSSSSSSSSS